MGTFEWFVIVPNQNYDSRYGFLDQAVKLSSHPRTSLMAANYPPDSAQTWFMLPLRRRMCGLKMSIIRYWLLHREFHCRVSFQRIDITILVSGDVFLALCWLWVIRKVRRACQPTKRLHGVIIPSATDQPTPSVWSSRWGFFGYVAPSCQSWERVAYQRVNGREIGDIDGNGGFAVEPIQVFVRHKRRVAAIYLAKDGSHDNERSHTKDRQKNELLLQRNLCFEQ